MMSGTCREHHVSGTLIVDIMHHMIVKAVTTSMLSTLTTSL